MRKWCHLNGEHGPHDWNIGMYQCSGRPAPEDEEPEADEQVSVCCGAPEDPDIESFCSACREGTGFEPATEEATR